MLATQDLRHKWWFYAASPMLLPAAAGSRVAMTAGGSRVGTAGSRVAAGGSRVGIAGSRVSSRVGPQSTFATAGATLPSTDLSLPDYLCNGKPVSLLWQTMHN